MSDTPVIIAVPKSHLVGLVLTFFFGPLGLLYASPIASVVMIILTLIVGFFTFGLGLILGWLISIIWSILAIILHNRKANAKSRAHTSTSAKPDDGAGEE